MRTTPVSAAGIGAVVALVVVVAWACSTSPSTVVGFVITGPATLAPGQTGRFTATVTRSGGSVENVTTSSNWLAQPDTVTKVLTPGTIAALAAGSATLTASFEGRSAVLAVAVIPADTFHVSGTVRDSSGAALRGVSVSAFGANGLFVTLAQTDGNGAYTLTGVHGDVTLETSYAGALPVTQSLSVAADRTGVDFTLAVSPGTINIAGTWSAVFTAPPDCASLLPAEARQRTYTVAVNQISLVEAYVSLSSSQQAPGSNDFDLKLSGTSITLLMPDDVYYGEIFGGMLERLSPTNWLDVVGTVTATIAGPTITGSFAGTFDSYNTPSSAAFLADNLVPTVSCQGVGTAVFQQSGATTARRKR